MDRLVEHHIKDISGLVDGGEPGTFEALVAVFNNIDSYGDRLVNGAFTKTLAERKDPWPIVYSHRWSETVPIGKSLATGQTDDGLVVRGQLYLDGDYPVELAKGVYRNLIERTLTQWSFGYDVIKGQFVDTDEPEAARFGGQVYELHEVKLYEVGPCLVGVNQMTDLLSVKGVATPEAVLRERMATRRAAAGKAWDAESRMQYIEALTRR